MRCSRAMTTVTTITSEPTLMSPREMRDMPMPNIERMKRASRRPFVTSSHSDHHHSRRWETRWCPIDSPTCCRSCSASPVSWTVSMLEVVSTIFPRSRDEDSA